MDPAWPPPRKRPSPDPFQTPVRPAHLSGVYTFGRTEVPLLDPDDEPTIPGGPQGLEYQAAILVRAFRESSPADRAWFLRVLDLAAWAKEKTI